MSPKYEFSGVPLTPSVVASLIRARYQDGEVFSRQDAINSIVQEHIARGGLHPRGAPESLFKKALNGLQEEGRVEQTGARGYWRVVAPAIEVGAEAPVEAGTGPETVYVYFFSAYRDQAAYRGRNTWPIKVGMTKGTVPVRLRDQIGTAMPEDYTLGLIYSCADAKTLESAIQGTLRQRGKAMNGPGREWFDSSVSEVLEIIDFIG